jgi:hypothetical protein
MIRKICDLLLCSFVVAWVFLFITGALLASSRMLLLGWFALSVFLGFGTLLLFGASAIPLVLVAYGVVTVCCIGYGWCCVLSQIEDRIEEEWATQYGMPCA